MRARLEPAFLDGFQGGRRFALWIVPPSGIARRGAILCVQPFGDEANLARRVLVAQATRLADLGWTTLIMDPFGTGDSDGRTDEARLAIWCADLLRASRIARERADGPFVLWGTRIGALLAAELGIALDQIASGYVFWQPPTNGAAVLDPLLKLASVGAIVRGAAPTSRVASIDGAASMHSAASTSSAATAAAHDSARADASAGIDPRAAQPATGDDERFIDLAGYRLRAELIDDLRTTVMQPPVLGEGGAPCPVLMLGIQRVVTAGAVAPQALSELAGRWLAAGYLTSLRVVQGEPFWNSLEPSIPTAAFAETEFFFETIDGLA